MKDGFVRVAAVTPSIRVGDCDNNATEIVRLAKEGAVGGASLIVFPELCVTGYTCGDLFSQSALLDAAESALLRIAEETAQLECVIAVGLPFKDGTRLYNVAAVMSAGKILGFVPKMNIPNYSEFYEMRHFAPGDGRRDVTFGGQSVPFGDNLLFCCRELSELVIGFEICEDVWVVNPPSGALAEGGATIICNLSASDEVVGKASYRRTLVTGQSARLMCAYVYADAGEGESSTDMVFAGHNIIAENATVLAESGRFTTGLTYADVDVARMEGERRRVNTYENGAGTRKIPFNLTVRDLDIKRYFSPTPFVPIDDALRDERCKDILAIQAEGLATRLRHVKGKSAVLGLSGGLDSTLALIVTARAFDRLGLDKKGITAVTMPCFGTTKRTRGNAEKLAVAYGTDFMEIDIKESVTLHLQSIGRDTELHDVTYENAQARERTQVLMDIANYKGGLVVGTGDLSELALGWATYNGDHMSMYGVNASIPKTLVRHLVAYEAAHSDPALSAVLTDVLNTPVSPELLPPVDGEISQRTEELVGPYELHDFFLFYFARYGFTPSKIYRLARLAFGDAYDGATVKRWLITFLRRFFSQQFKRSCLPDGPKVGTVTLSPRGDWRMPSDASCRVWLDEAEAIEV